MWGADKELEQVPVAGDLHGVYNVHAAAKRTAENSRQSRVTQQGGVLIGDIARIADSNRTRVGAGDKRREAPELTPSMRIALADLRLDQLTVVHAGKESWPMAARVRAVAAQDLLAEVPPLD